MKWTSHVGISLAMIAVVMLLLPGPWDRGRLMVIAGALTSSGCVFAIHGFVIWWQRYQAHRRTQDGPR